MLRIKDNVDLKELEKFGFEEEVLWKGKKTGIYKFYNRVTEDSLPNYIKICQDREICIKCYYDMDFETIICGLLLDVIYDLIQAGLVEKVED